MNPDQRKFYNRLLTIQRKIDDIDVDFQSNDFEDSQVQVWIGNAAIAIMEALQCIQKEMKK